MITEALRPFLRGRYALLQHCKRTTAITSSRCKTSTRNTAVATSTSNQTALDTNVRPMGEKVKEATKTVSYLGVILLGIGVTGTLFYTVFNELFSSRSPNNIYTAAVKRCLADYRVEDKLGLPISAYGEENRKGRRQHPNYMGFLGRDGKKHLRMKFYLQGAFHKGTAVLEMIENAAGDFDYLYLIVEVNDMNRTTIVVEQPVEKAPANELLL